MPRDGFRYEFQILCWEGAFAMVYETWIGPTYLSGMAGELGVSVALLSLFTAVPWLGAVAQLASTWTLHGSPSVKRYVVRLATIARSLWLIPVSLAWCWGIHAALRHEPFPAVRWFGLTCILACVSACVATASGVAWMAWVRELVPAPFFGRFFGVRQRFTMGAVILAHGVGFFLVSWKPGGYSMGFGLMLAGALVCAVFSTLLLTRIPDATPAPESRSRCEREGGGQWLQRLREPLGDSRFRDILIFSAVFNGTIQLAGPFFPYYFTRELRIPMSTIAFWTVLMNLGWFLAAVAWGKWMDRKRDRLGAGFWVATHMICLSPIYYVVPGLAWATRVGPIDYFTNGIAWAGYSLFLTTRLMSVCPRGKSAYYFSVNSAASGLSGVLGNLLGAQLAIALQPWGGFRALWVVTTASRLAVLWGLHRLLMQDGRPTRPTPDPGLDTRALPEPA
jgi:hypothetical protein